MTNINESSFSGKINGTRAKKLEKILLEEKKLKPLPNYLSIVHLGLFGLDSFGKSEK